VHKAIFLRVSRPTLQHVRFRLKTRYISMLSIVTADIRSKESGRFLAAQKLCALDL
jgi:hypothetical protein